MQQLRQAAALALQICSNQGFRAGASRSAPSVLGTLSSRGTQTCGRPFSNIVTSLGAARQVCRPNAWALQKLGALQHRAVDVKLKLRRHMIDVEHRTVAIVCSLGDTRSGQMLLATVLPVAAMMYLFPARFRSLAWSEMGPIQRHDREASMLKKRRRRGGETFSGPFSAHLSSGLTAVLEESLLCLRACYLLVLFSPLLFSAPFLLLWDLGGVRGREVWYDLVLATIENAGPAFIKWAQWSSSRPDLFPRELCRRLERLQSGAPEHAPEHSITALAEAFRGLPPAETDASRRRGGSSACSPASTSSSSLPPVFEYFESLPVASGSIAQVHRARLSAYGARLTGGRKGQVVAVKVRHPGVTKTMLRDVQLMQRAARLCSLIPGVADLRLEESIRQFGGPLMEQLDLSAEARNLRRFSKNFRTWRNVSFPRPLYPLVAPGVLVETFEEGALISGLVNVSGSPSPSAERDEDDGAALDPSSSSAFPESSPASSHLGGDDGSSSGGGTGRSKASQHHRGLLAEAGLDLFLQMLLKDNYVHADLHPGNIMVKDAFSSTGCESTARMIYDRFLSLATPLLGPPPPKLVLLDAGMVAELDSHDQKSLVEFFRALTNQDGEDIARNVLPLSEQHTCKDPEAFVSAMGSLFAPLSAEYIRNNTQEVFHDMIDCLRQHHVTLKSTVSTVVVTTLVLEGWSSKLKPDLHILDRIRDLLSSHDWVERVKGSMRKLVPEDELDPEYLP